MHHGQHLEVNCALTVTSPDAQTASVNFNIDVTDIVPPTPVITSSAELFTGGWKTGINEDTAFSCSSIVMMTE